MAALDFGMAMARGMLPTSEEAQKDLLNLAGGRNIFKSEDWWNKAVDEQISSGYRKVKEEGREFLLPSGEYQLGRRNVSSSYTRPAPSGPFGSMQSSQSSNPFFRPAQPSSPLQAVMMGYTVNTNVSYEDPTGGRALSSRPVDVYEGRTYFTGGELSDIERSAEAGSKRAKREAAQAETSKKRLTRGTGGLAAKARPVGAKATTGLPELGTGGLQLGTTSLGKGLFV